MWKRLVFFFFFSCILFFAGILFFHRLFRPPPRHIVERPERTITIIPGWNLRDVARYFDDEGVASTTLMERMLGEPGAAKEPTLALVSPEIFSLPLLKDKPRDTSMEGYLAPETYRIFADASPQDIVKKLVVERSKQFSDTMLADIAASGKSLHEILTMASIVEQEVKAQDDRGKVADIFWRRIARGWALQADSTVHYVVGKDGSVFTSARDRDADSPWNTYKYPGLPPGPICNPSIESIMAAIYPTKNDFWYFLTGSDGTVHYARTLEEHNKNRMRYLR